MAVGELYQDGKEAGSVMSCMTFKHVGTVPFYVVKKFCYLSFTELITYPSGLLDRCC